MELIWRITRMCSVGMMPIAARPAVQRGVQVLAENQRQGAMTDAEREVMFGKTQFAVR